MKNLKNLGWAIVATCTVKNNGKNENFKKVIAAFTYPFLAQEYIDKCLPPENRDRFRIERI